MSSTFCDLIDLADTRLMESITAFQRAQAEALQQGQNSDLDESVAAAYRMAGHTLGRQVAALQAIRGTVLI